MISGAQQGWIEALQGYLGSGGLVMPVLVLVTVVLWYAIGCRWSLLNRGSRKNVRVMIKRREDGRSKSLRGIV
ncbi:MAG: hypothetical protein R3E70_16205, partial [Burkholderiaceae bacterium]